MRRADDDHVAADDGCCVQPDLAVDEIHLLIVVELQIDHAVGAEAAGRMRPVFASSAIRR